MSQPFVSTSLQAAPGFPHGADQRPKKSCLPEYYELIGGGAHTLTSLLKERGSEFPDATWRANNQRFTTLTCVYAACKESGGDFTWYASEGWDDTFRRNLWTVTWNTSDYAEGQRFASRTAAQDYLSLIHI